jgi:hypothetical protein
MVSADSQPQLTGLIFQNSVPSDSLILAPLQTTFNDLPRFVAAHINLH